MIIDKGYNLSDIYLVPRQISEINSRNDVDTSIEFCGNKLSLPLIASPMPDVCDGKMASELYKRGLFGFIHRFNTVKEQCREYCDTKISDCGCAIGINGDWYDRFLTLLNAGVTDFIIDTANGANRRVDKCIETMLKRSNNINIIAGNVATKEGYRFLAQYPLHAIRVGISGGYACSTRFETAIHNPLASSLIEIIEERNTNQYPTSTIDVLSKNKNIGFPNFPLIIADGGINNPHDFCIALALGADLVMCGKIFAQCYESPARTLNIDGKLKKIYRGAASFSNQVDYTGERPNYVEGFEQIIDYGGKLSDLIKRFSGGLRSAMSYMNARNLNEFRKNSNFCRV